jgi:YHS domain-containing protein
MQILGALFVFFGLFLTSVTNSHAAPEKIYTSFFSKNAVGGYDTVAYFTEGKPVKGKKQFATSYGDVTWLFASNEHKELFLADPTKYAPQYGGYCAYAAAKNQLASADPEAWKIVDEKLYLNYDKDIQRQWEAQEASYIRQADVHWPTLKNK